jgi:hypothetical protein
MHALAVRIAERIEAMHEADHTAPESHEATAREAEQEAEL